MTSNQFDASKLGGPNSDLYWRTVISASGPKQLLMATKYAQAANYANLVESVQLNGSPELVAANLRSIAKLTSDEHVPLRVISFFSGSYSNAVMLYEAKQDPEDVIELSYLPSFEDLINQLENEVKAAGQKASVVRGSERPAIALIIDDFSAFLVELEGRGLKRNALLELIPGLKDRGIALYAGTLKDSHPMFTRYPVLKDFDGYISNL